MWYDSSEELRPNPRIDLFFAPYFRGKSAMAVWMVNDFGGYSGNTMSDGALAVAGRVNCAPYGVKPAPKPPWARKNWPFSTPMKRSSRSALPVGSWLKRAVVSSIHRPSAVRIHWLPYRALRSR